MHQFAARPRRPLNFDCAECAFEKVTVLCRTLHVERRRYGVKARWNGICSFWHADSITDCRKNSSAVLRSEKGSMPPGGGIGALGSVLPFLGALYPSHPPSRKPPAVEYNDFPAPPDWNEKTEWVFARLMFPPG